MADRVTVTIAVPLEQELAEAIAAADSRVKLIHRPELLPPTRYPGDHRGADDYLRSAADQRRFNEMIEEAEVLFGIPGDSSEGLADAVQRGARLRWVQATAAGAGQQVRAAGLTPAQLGRVVVTSASGVHAVPLAEFCLLGLLAFVKGLPRLLEDKAERHWDHYPTAELRDRTLLIVGLGQIGAEVARLAAAFGMHVVGLNRRGASDSPDVQEVDPIGELGRWLPRADALVITLPLTAETEALLDAQMVSRIKPGAVVVNVGRGGVIDEAALVEALRSGRVSGAALDVFAAEPLPPDSPLWELENVLVSPHTAALSLHENERIVALFLENVGRYLAGQELLNRVDPELLY